MPDEGKPEPESKPEPAAPPPAAPPEDTGYTASGVPTFDSVREKIETRYGTAIGAAELDAESTEGRTIEEQYDARQRAADGAHHEPLRRALGPVVIHQHAERVRNGEVAEIYRSVLHMESQGDSVAATCIVGEAKVSELRCATGNYSVTFRSSRESDASRRQQGDH